MLSARGKTTDDLIRQANEISDRPSPREMDMLLSTGERISCALCAMAIWDMGHQAISLTGSQAGIVTDSSHTKARILDVRADRIAAALAEDNIVLVAGFQGVSGDSKDVTTLGRGGSDTTAVALAAALEAEVCEIYTDVAGVFSADPRIVPDARKIAVVSFEEMLEMSASGAKVLQLRSVEYARNYDVPIHCRSSFDEGTGTLVVSENETMERPLVTAVAHSSDEARVTLAGISNEPGVAGHVFGNLADANVNVDVIIQNEPVSSEHGADLSFTVARDDLQTALEAIETMGIERRQDPHRRADRQGLDRRRRHAQPSRRRRQGLRRARRRRHQHPHDLDLADQDQLRDRRRSGARRGPEAARRLRARRGRDPGGAADRHPPPAPGDPVSFRVGVLGATGAVGSTILEILAERSFPVSELVPFASERSAGKPVRFGDSEVACVTLSDESIQGLDLVISSAGGAVSSEWAPKLVEAGAVVVDNTSFWRMHADVPLVVPEVNPDDIDGHRGLVANPNCSTMQMVVALKPILDAAGIERLVVSTYQSVSGTGQRAIEELKAQSRATLAGDSAPGRDLPAPDRLQRPAPGRDLQGRRRLHDRRAQDDGRDPQDPRRRRVRARDLRDLRPGPRLQRPFGVGQRPDRRGPEPGASAASCSPRRRDCSSSTTPRNGIYPLATEAAGRDEVLVGRIRRDPSHERCLNLWIVGDNLRKGAATNAVQVAELLAERDLVRVPEISLAA